METDLKTNESEDSSSDDSDAYLLTEEVEQQIQATLKALRENHPSIYDKTSNFAPEIDFERAKKERQANRTERQKHEQEQLLEAEKYRIKEFLQEQVERGGDSDQDDSSDEDSVQISDSEKASLIAGFKDVEGADEDDFFSMEDSKVDEDGETNVQPKEKKIRRDPSRLDKDWVPLAKDKADDDFLHKYFANEWWRGENLEEIPVHRGLYGYQELLYEEKVSKNKYRHQDSGGAQIKAHPRNVEGSVRKKNNKRKRQRENKKIREEEKKKKAATETKKKKKEFTKKINDIAKNIQKKHWGEITAGLFRA